jgi:hypothetical protein
MNINIYPDHRKEALQCADPEDSKRRISSGSMHTCGSKILNTDES